MSNVIQFLESLARNPTLNRLSSADYVATVATLDIDESQQQALLDRDHATLNSLLGGRAKVLFALFPADDDDQKQDDDRRDDGGESPDSGEESPSKAN